jgi:hypothetical protein
VISFNYYAASHRPHQIDPMAVRPFLGRWSADVSASWNVGAARERCSTAVFSRHAREYTHATGLEFFKDVTGFGNQNALADSIFEINDCGRAISCTHCLYSGRSDFGKVVNAPQARHLRDLIVRSGQVGHCANKFAIRGFVTTDANPSRGVTIYERNFHTKGRLSAGCVLRTSGAIEQGFSWQDDLHDTP